MDSANRITVWATIFHAWYFKKNRTRSVQASKKKPSKSRISHFQLFLLSLATATVSNTASAAVGSVAGEVSVLPSGASSYTVPLQVAPGIAGMTPGISLQYNSQSGNSLLGVGWSIGGLSTIHRCLQTIEQDGKYQGIQM